MIVSVPVDGAARVGRQAGGLGREISSRGFGTAAG
jgi:hypothetical protein